METSESTQLFQEEINDVNSHTEILLKKLHDLIATRVIENKVPRDSQDWVITQEEANAISDEIKDFQSKIEIVSEGGFLVVKGEVCKLFQLGIRGFSNSKLRDPKIELQENDSIGQKSAMTSSQRKGKEIAPLLAQTTTIFNKETEKQDTKSATTYALQDVKVLTPIPSTATDIFFKEFEKKLEEQGLRAIETNVDTIDGQTTCSDVVIVICHNHSRLQSNVKNALMKINNRKYEVFLVILHIKILSDLPREPSKIALESETCTDRIYDVVDVAYTKTEGIYDCPINKQAFEAMCNLKQKQ